MGRGRECGEKKGEGREKGEGEREGLMRLQGSYFLGLRG